MNEFMPQERREEIRQRLMTSTLTLKFQLSDGHTTSMTATRNGNLIPKQDLGSHPGPPHNDLQVVWDLEQNQWRAFRWERLIEVKDK